MSSPADRVTEAAPAHACTPPTIGAGTVPDQPDWTCGSCGRIWRDMRNGVGLQWWAEIRRPVDASDLPVAAPDHAEKLSEHRKHAEWLRTLNAADMDGLSAVNITSRLLAVLDLVAALLVERQQAAAEIDTLTNSVLRAQRERQQAEERNERLEKVLRDLVSADWIVARGKWSADELDAARAVLADEEEGK